MKAGHHTERELKFDAGGAAVSALGDLPRVVAVVPAESQELDAVYFDTADLRLLRRGVTLRRRTGGRDAGWHLKIPVPGARDTRTELRAPVGPADPGAIPPELELQVRGYVRGRPLAPVADLRTHRSRHLLMGRKGRVLAEVAADEVAAHVLDVARLTGAGAPSARSGGSTTELTTWTELEVELVDGGSGLLDAVESRLARAGVRRSVDASKLEHLLGAFVPAPARTGAKRRGTIGAVLLERLRQQTGILVGLDAAVRHDEPDSVHQMRVAVRRMRSALKTYPGVLAPDRAAQLADELKWLGGVLGAARDTEVVKALLDARVDALPGEPEHLDAFFADRYHSAWRAAVEQLEGDRYYQLLDSLDAVQAMPPWGPRAKDPARRALRRAAGRQQSRTAKRIEAAYTAEPGPLRDTAWHEARKAAKRARYAGETARPAGGKAAKRFADRMKQVQQTLGQRQDTVIARQELGPLARRAADEGRDTFGYATLYADLLTEAAEHEERLGAVWDRAARVGLPGM